MTNIDNIRAMLQSVQDELDGMKLREETLKARKATLLAWLQEEAPNAVQSELSIDEDTSALAAFVSSILASKKMKAGQLGELAVERGLIKGDSSPGRVVHGALIGLMKQGRAKRDPDGTWSLL